MTLEVEDLGNLDQMVLRDVCMHARVKVQQQQGEYPAKHPKRTVRNGGHVVPKKRHIGICQG